MTVAIRPGQYREFYTPSGVLLVGRVLQIFPAVRSMRNKRFIQLVSVETDLKWTVIESRVRGIVDASKPGEEVMATNQVSVEVCTKLVVPKDLRHTYIMEKFYDHFRGGDYRYWVVGHNSEVTTIYIDGSYVKEVQEWLASLSKK